MLTRKGHEVHFLLRSDYEAVKKHGVQVRSARGDFQVFPHAAAHPAEIGPADVVLIALKTTANTEFSRLLPPLVGPHTAVITLQNGLGNEEQLATLFRPHQILGGLCFVCLNRVAPGIVHHLEHGLIMLGEFEGGPRERTNRLAETFRQTGVPCQVTENLARAHWEKLTWNIPFNGLGVASVLGFEAVATGHLPKPEPPHKEPCLTTDRLLADPRWLRLLQELMAEVAAAAAALGYPLDPGIITRQVERTHTMGAYKASTLLDFENGRPLELQSLFLEPLRQAKQAGVPVPRMQALVTALRHLAK